MTNRQRVLAVLKGETPDYIPFTIYDWKIPMGFDKRKLRERGLVMMSRFPGYKIEYPNCELKTESYTKDGVFYEREIVKTPAGEISSLFLPGQTYNVRKQIEFWLKSENDYEPLMFMVKDAVIKPAYEDILAAREALGEDGVAYIWAGYSPLQEIIIHLTGIEQFCYELADRPEMIWALYDSLCQMDRKKYPVLAAAPVEMVEYCANPIASLLGKDLFVDKILPCLNDCADILHSAGKIQAVHVDGDNSIWAEDLAGSAVDIIEAFTPAPDTDMTMSSGRKVFKDKIIWANFPSSLHLASIDEIKAAARAILDAVSPGERFLLGITEDIPADHWRKSLNAILDVIDEYGKLPLRGKNSN